MENQKIVIEFLALLGGHSQPFVIEFFEKMATSILMAPFFIHWGGENRTEGCIEISIEELVGNSNLLDNMDNDKVTDWVIRELESMPKDKRNQRWIRGISLDLLKLWQKESKK